MSMRLVALDEGPDIPVDRTMVIVGRHPQCDARLDSIRVSRRHCCMSADNNEVVVRDLGSTNGIRINGQRVETGRLKAGDELSIAHIRYRLDAAPDVELTLADAGHSIMARPAPVLVEAGSAVHEVAPPQNGPPEQRLASAVRELFPSALGDRCRIQVIVQMQPDQVAEEGEECPPDSSH